MYRRHRAEVGTTLDVTTANLPTNAAISNAGGILVFDQSISGTFTGVMSDGKQAGGLNDPNDLACTLVSCSGPTLSGTLIKDDSATGSGGNVTIANVQSYTGMTYIEAGTITPGAVNAIETSAGVILGRVGGSFCNPSPCSGVTATLALGANNTIQGLADNAGNTTSVVLNGYTLDAGAAERDVMVVRRRDCRRLFERQLCAERTGHQHSHRHQHLHGHDNGECRHTGR